MTSEDRHIDASDGTSEAVWLGWNGFGKLAEFGAGAEFPWPPRIVVVAPHPDDEVLSVGGLLARQAGSGRQTMIVAVTDGDASHPHSSEWPVEKLRRTRTSETAEALIRLGQAETPVRLRIPDGQVSANEHLLTQELASLLRPDDWVFTTFRLDGHPDHEATGRACAAAVEMTGGRLFEVPVWAWHWAQPEDDRLPWHRAVRFNLSPEEVHRKIHAVQAFRSQLLPDPSTGSGAILRGSTVARAARPFEVFFS